MDALPTVEFDDVDSRYDGDLSTEFEQGYVEAQIQDAVDFSTARWRDKILSRLASGALTPNLYRRVISDVVLRVIRNPGGLASENEGGVGYSTRVSVASGDMRFMDSDVETLCGSTSTVVPGTIGIGLDRGWR